ncbi:MAG: metallophosphoesterase family protein [Myxococcota bacterium]
MVLGIVGDVHANAGALDAGLAMLRTRPIDQLVFLGDLLTYGPDVDPVLSRVEDELAGGARIVLGNHDRMYLDLSAGEQAYFDALPPWVRESADWTRGQFDIARFQRIPFAPTAAFGEVLVAHANPFPPDPSGFPDWRYLTRAADHQRAADHLRLAGARVGVFGHTHRSRIVELPSLRGVDDEDRRILDGWRPVGEGDALSVNAGTVGQPRNRSATSTVAWVTAHDDGRFDVEIAPIAYDVDRHLAALEALPFSPHTAATLARFFEPGD